MKRWIVALSLLALLPQANAGSLATPFAMDSAGVLPKGVRNVRFTGFTSEISDKFDSSGQMVPLGSNFDKKVSWRELTEEVPAGFERANLRGGLEGMGIQMDGSAGDARGLVDARVTINTPTLAYGVTDTVTVGVGVPVVYSSTNVSAGWTAGPEWEALARAGYSSKIKLFQAKLENVVATKIAKYNYKTLENEQRTEVGDVVLGGKYQFYKAGALTAALAPKVVIPTGRVADVDKVVDIAPGDGQWDVGLAAVADYQVSPLVTLTSSASYTHQVGANKAMRVPLTADESLSPDVDSEVNEKLGDMMSTGLGGRVRIHPLWTAGASYAFQYKLANTYSGSRYSSERYGYLGLDTEQNPHSAQAGLTFSSLPLFQAKKFALPLEATISYAAVLAGRNVNKLDLTTFELSAFF